MQYRYYTLDVFTNTRFGGNPLAVLPDAAGLSTEQMQAITREFNYSEATFVLAPEDPAAHRKVRIFMPTKEVPFAGHPNVGTAYALAATGALGELGDGEHSVVFEELAGNVPVRIRIKNGRPIDCELAAPQTLELGPPLTTPALAPALGLAGGDLVTDGAVVASAGLAFATVELHGADALARANVSASAWDECGVGTDGVLVYVREGERDVRCRMFAPSIGIPEDPATGSAVCALAGVLAKRDFVSDGEVSYRIRQGVEMGRPSELSARAVMVGGEPSALFVGGPSVMVMEGTLNV